LHRRFAWDRSYSYVAVAGLTYTGRAEENDVYAQVIQRRAGTEWVIPWLLSAELAEARTRWVAVTVQAKGAPVSTLVDELEASDLPFTPWQGGDLSIACGQFYDLVRLPEGNEPKRRLWHPPQPVADVPASTATTRPLGDGWVLDRRGSPVDCSPLIAEVGAVWALQSVKVIEPSAYESRGLLVV
jgi:hypothetical protein